MDGMYSIWVHVLDAWRTQRQAWYLRAKHKGVVRGKVRVASPQGSPATLIVSVCVSIRAFALWKREQTLRPQKMEA